MRRRAIFATFTPFPLPLPMFRPLAAGFVSLSCGALVSTLAAASPAGAPIEDAAARARLPLEQVVPAATAAELTPAQPETHDFRTWGVSHGDPGSRRYSALTQIDRTNVHRLREAWTYRSKDVENLQPGWRGVQSNAIVVGDTLFAPTAGRAIVALDAVTGRERWRYQVEQPRRVGLEDAPARRGLVYWPGQEGHAPRVVFASGTWLYALDPQTGKPLAGFGQNGRTPLPTGGTAVGVIWRGAYIVPGLKGDLFSFDLRDGRQLWRFHTIPKPGEFGADTWRGSVRDGANPWGGVALDDTRGIVFLAVGAPRPDFIGVERHGDNLFSNCLVAIEAATGRRLWHFQNVRHDIWDVDNPAPPNLVTVTRDGRKIDAVACVTKTGITLLVDRVTGKSIFPFELRRAPASKLPGEVTAPYQPAPRLPEPFSKMDFGRDDVTDRSPDTRASVEAQLARANLGWFEPFELGKPTAFFGIHGGSEWPGGAVDVATGRLYVAANHIPWTITVFRDDDPPPAQPATAGDRTYQQFCAACHGPDRRGIGTAPPLRGLRHGMDDAGVRALLQTGRGAMPPMPQLDDAQRAALLDFLFARDRPAAPAAGRAAASTTPRYAISGYRKLLDADGYPGSKPPWGTLNCLDLNTGKILWRVPLGEHPEITPPGAPKTGTENFGGASVTAGGLVFVAGTRDEKIRAFDKDTGEELWSAKLPWGGFAPPSIYEAGGRQFVVIAATGGGKLAGPSGDAWVAFALPSP